MWENYSFKKAGDNEQCHLLKEVRRLVPTWGVVQSNASAKKGAASRELKLGKMVQTMGQEDRDIHPSVRHSYQDDH